MWVFRPGCFIQTTTENSVVFSHFIAWVFEFVVFSKIIFEIQNRILENHLLICRAPKSMLTTNAFNTTLFFIIISSADIWGETILLRLSRISSADLYQPATFYPMYCYSNLFSHEDYFYHEENYLLKETYLAWNKWRKHSALVGAWLSPSVFDNFSSYYVTFT